MLSDWRMMNLQDSQLFDFGLVPSRRLGKSLDINKQIEKHMKDLARVSFLLTNTIDPDKHIEETAK